MDCVQIYILYHFYNLNVRGFLVLSLDKHTIKYFASISVYRPCLLSCLSL